MATKAILIDSSLAEYTAEDFSSIQKFTLEEGVLGNSAGTMGLAVSQHAAGANLSVDVSIGNALLDFTKNFVNWKIIALSNAIENVVIPTQSSGSNRIGAVILRASIVTEPNALKNNIVTLEYVVGTSTSPLSDGDIDTAVSSDAWIRLANVTVPTGATSIVTGNISDVRVQVATNQATKLSPQVIYLGVLGSDPTTLVEGMTWYNSSTHSLNFYNGTTVKTLGTTAGVFNPFLTTEQSSPDKTLAVASGEVRYGSKEIHYAGGNSPSFISPSFAGDISIALNPSNTEDITLTINGTGIVIHLVSSIGAVAGNVLIGSTAAETRARVAAALNNPSTTSSTQVAFSAPNQTLLGYYRFTDDLSLKIFCEPINALVTSFAMSETMAGSGNVVALNTTKNRIDLLYLDNTGTLGIQRGDYSASPVAPNYRSNILVLAEVYCRRGMTSVKTSDDSVNGYIYRDARGFLVENVKFGGDGSDGELVVNGINNTINLGGAAVFIKNYTSIYVEAGFTLNFSNPASAGTIIILKSQGNVVVKGTIDVSGMGGAGGAGGAGGGIGANGVDGTAGSASGLVLDAVAHSTKGLKGTGGAYTHGAAVSAPAAYTTTGGVGLFYTLLDPTNNKFRKMIYLVSGVGGAGAGGGGGGTGGTGTAGVGAAGGAGGAAGGALYIECAGALNFAASGVIHADGVNGTNGSVGGNPSGGTAMMGGSGGGGGGGAGGQIYLLYNSLTANAGTISATGGNGGNGANSNTGAGSAGSVGGGGSGGTGGSSFVQAGGSAAGGGGNGVSQNFGGAGGAGGAAGVAGSTGANGTGGSSGGTQAYAGAGGAGGGGAGGAYHIGANTEFA